jgi:Protein of unknown function (DUF1501)
MKPGQTIGETDEFGFSPVGERMDIHDLHATILRLFGLDPHAADNQVSRA